MALKDWLGRMVQRAPLRGEHSAPTEGGARSVQRPYAEILEPEQLAAALRESARPGYGQSERYLDMAEQMEESYLHYGGVLGTRKRQVAQIPIRIEPASDSASDVDDADLVRAFFGRPEFGHELFDILDALGKSFSVSEIVWDVSAGQWMPQRLVWRLPQWFDFDRETGTRLLVRGAADSGAQSELPAWKYVTHYGQSKSGMLIRGGLARPAAWAWMAHNFTASNWLRFAEQYGQPPRIGRYDSSVRPEDHAILKRALRNISTDFAAVIGSGMDIELLSDSQAAARAEIFSGLVGYLDRQVSIHVLGQTLTTDAGDSGSYALGAVHNQVREDIERADAQLLATTLRRDLVRPIVALNHGERDAYPQVIIKREEAADAKMICEAIATLIPHGLRVRVDDVRPLLGLQAPDEEDEVLEMSAPPAASPAASRTNAALALLAARPGSVGDDAVSRAVAEHLDAHWVALTDPMIEPILSSAAAAQDYDQLRSKLPELFDDMDDAAIRRLLTHLGFSGQVSASSDGEE